MKAMISKKATVRRGRQVHLRLTNARATQDLGGGFLRSVFNPLIVGPNRFLTITFTAGTGRVVINAGWSISAFAAAWPTDSYPSSDTRWILIIQNPTNFTRTVIPYLITKTR